MSSTIKQFSRDFSEDPDYSPSWRANQAMEYRRVYRDLVSRGEENIVVVPPEESDEYIIDYFSYLIHGAFHFPEIKYAHSCFNSNHVRGFGTQIQAMFLGQKTVSEIAESFKTKEKNIECFLKMFFDVSNYLDCENLIYSLISPYDRWKETPLDVVANSIWMGLSYEFGWDTAKYILQRRLQVTEKIAEKLSNAMKQSLSLQASEYVLGVRLVNHARPSDFERHIAYTNALSFAEKDRDQGPFSNGDLFRNALWAGITETSVMLDKSDPVRKMIGEKEREMRNIGNTVEIKELTYSTPQPL